LKQIVPLGLVLSILFLSATIQGQEDASRYVEVLEKKYAGLKDYVVEVRVHFDIETFKAPDIKARLFYKAPDKVKVESKQVLFFPREGGYFNPSLFKREKFTPVLLERLMHQGRQAVRLRLIPKEVKKNGHDTALTIDTEQMLVREADVIQPGGREIKAKIEYGRFSSFDLPTRIDLFLDFPASEPEMFKGFDLSPQGTKRVKGRIELTYSDYRVNTGLSDEFFKEAGPQKP